MEEIKFRPRILPMPKVGDEIKDVYGNTSVVSAHNKYEPSLFSVVLSDGKHHCYDSLDNIWSWQDPVVESQRLMEAAYRADTSPLPESLLESIEMASEEGDMEADNVLAILIEQHPATIVFALVPHLLRWQYRQQLKESESC